MILISRCVIRISFLLLKDGAVYDYGGASVITRESIRDVYNLDVEVLNHGDKKFIILN